MTAKFVYYNIDIIIHNAPVSFFRMKKPRQPFGAWGDAVFGRTTLVLHMV